MHRKGPPNHLRLSTQQNIARLKLQSEFDNSDSFTYHQSLSPLKNIGLGVTEKKNFPESSVCEITEINETLESKAKIKQGCIDSFYTRRKGSIKLLSKLTNQSIEDIGRPDCIFQTADSNDLTNEMMSMTVKTSNNRYKEIMSVRTKEVRRRTFFKCTRMEIRPKIKPLHGNTISIQTDEVLHNNDN